MKTKYWVIGLCAVFVVGLVACGHQAAQEPTEQSQGVQQTEPVTEPSVEPTATPVEIKQEVPQQNGTGQEENTEPVEPADPEETDPSGEAGGDDETTPEPEGDPFTEVNEQVWATSGVNLRSGPGVGYDKVGSMSKGQQATRTGIGIDEAEGWSRIQLSDNSIVYVSSDYVSTTPVQQNTTTNGGGGTSTNNGTTAGTDSQTTTPPSSSTGTGTDTDLDAQIQAQIDAALRQQQEAIANGETVGSGDASNVTDEFIEGIGNKLGGGN